MAGLCRLGSPISGKAGVILCPDVSPNRPFTSRLPSIIFNFFISNWVADFRKQRFRTHLQVVAIDIL
jgi:hypothetical protein